MTSLKNNYQNVDRQNQSATSSYLPIHVGAPRSYNTAGDTSLDSSLVAPEGIMEPSRRISPIRRAFCLLTLFDFLFTVIIWILYTQLIGLTSLSEAFEFQLIKYSFKTSVFDVVVLSFVRFLILVIFYAAIRVNNPWPVATTTAVSTIFIMVKIIFYDFQHKFIPSSSAGSPFDYMIFMVTLCLVWGETFLLDCRVLPVERQVMQYSSAVNERSSLLRYPLPWASTVPTEGFMTPETSPDHSDTEEDVLKNGRAAVSVELMNEYVQKAEMLKDQAWSLLQDTSSWTQVSDKRGSRVLSKSSSFRKGKSWRLELNVPISADRMFVEIWDKVDKQSDWNSNILFSRCLLTVNESVGVMHNAVVEAAGGMIKSRDFVTLRARDTREGTHFTGGVSVLFPHCPESQQFVRGENFPGCIACVPISDTSSTLVWIMDSDIKGWVPQSVIDQAMTMVLVQLGDNIQSHSEGIRQREGL